LVASVLLHVLLFHPPTHQPKTNPNPTNPRTYYTLISCSRERGQLAASAVTGQYHTLPHVRQLAQQRMAPSPVP